MMGRRKGSASGGVNSKCGDIAKMPPRLIVLNSSA